MKKLTYFYTVDLFRGLAAILILVWHYHHFYLYGLNTHIWDYSIQPFYTTFKFFYHQGFWLVSFFWVISGFVFAYVYLKTKPTLKDFMLHRFSRLYPLHLITLVAIALLQFSSIAVLGYYQIFDNSDLYHFISHLWFASYWQAGAEYSYNAPIWSVSVEIFIYFFLFCRT